MKKILLIKHGSLGDIISSTSIINDIRKHYLKDKIILLTSEKYINFFDNSNLINEAFIDNRKGFFSTIMIIKKIINLKPDLIIDLQNSQRTSIYVFIIRFFSRIKINSTSIFANYRYIYSKKLLPSVIDGLSNQVEILGIKTRRKPFLNWLNSNSFNFNEIGNKNYFIINPGCSKKNIHKRWPAINYAKICSYLISRGILPVVIGSNEDKEVLELIADKEKRIINLLNKSPINVIFALSQKAKGAISNDTGPAHLIAASGCNIHLLLSNFSNTKTVIPQGKNVSYTQSTNIENILVDDIIKKIQEIYNI